MPTTGGNSGDCAAYGTGLAAAGERAGSPAVRLPAARLSTTRLSASGLRLPTARLSTAGLSASWLPATRLSVRTPGLPTATDGAATGCDPVAPADSRRHLQRRHPLHPRQPESHAGPHCRRRRHRPDHRARCPDRAAGGDGPHRRAPRRGDRIDGGAAPFVWVLVDRKPRRDPGRHHAQRHAHRRRGPCRVRINDHHRRSLDADPWTAAAPDRSHVAGSLRRAGDHRCGCSGDRRDGRVRQRVCGVRRRRSAGCCCGGPGDLALRHVVFRPGGDRPRTPAGLCGHLPIVRVGAQRILASARHPRSWPAWSPRPSPRRCRYRSRSWR